MNILIKPELEGFVAEKVRSGQFADPSAIVNQALEVLREQEEFTPKHEAYLRDEIRRGVAQLDRGERSTSTAESIIAQERARMAARRG